jgi:hypothetical protein
MNRIDPARVIAIGGDAAAGRTVTLDEPPVRIFAAEERLAVTRAGVDLPLELHVGPGFHLTARNPGVEGLVPLTIEIRGGSGVRVEVTYPEGRPYEGEALPDEDRGNLMVYEGILRLTARLTRTEGPWTGRPLLTLTYQCCDDRACYQPITVELDVALDPE